MNKPKLASYSRQHVLGSSVNVSYHITCIPSDTTVTHPIYYHPSAMFYGIYATAAVVIHTETVTEYCNSELVSVVNNTTSSWSQSFIDFIFH